MSERLIYEKFRQLHGEKQRDKLEPEPTEMSLRIFKEALDCSTDAIGMSTPQGLHYYQNKAFDELFGIIGENPPETLYVDKTVGEEIFRIIMSGGKWAGEVNMYAKDGRILVIHLRAYANIDETGKIISLVGIHTDITEQKRMEDSLQASHKILEKKVKERTGELQDMNAALKVILKKRDDDKKEMEEKLFTHYNSLILPFFQKLKVSLTEKNQHYLMEIVESNLKEFLQPFSKKISDPLARLTPTEIQIASLIKQGLSNKEMSITLNSSIRTIEAHRANIRKKLDLKNKKINLSSYLLNQENT